MWQVITTTTPSSALSSVHQPGLLPTEIDALLEVLGKLSPQAPMNRRFPVQTRHAMRPPNQSTTGADTSAASYTFRPYDKACTTQKIGADVLSALALPRPLSAPNHCPLAPELRAQLLQLRATIMLAAQTKKTVAILLCGVGTTDDADTIASNLSHLIAEYERLQIATITVQDTHTPRAPKRRALPVGYTFQMRRTRQPNLYEIASSLGTIQLSDWLKWWEPQPVLQEMKRMFDVILIHAPAITTCPDVALLAGAVDGVILVATENVTSYASISAAKQHLQAAQANILGVTLQQLPPADTTFAIVKTRIRGLIRTLSSKNNEYFSSKK